MVNTVKALKKAIFKNVKSIAFAMVCTSILYILLSSIYNVEQNTMQMLLTISLMGIGVFILVGDADRLTTILVTVAKEVVIFYAAVISLYLILMVLETHAFRTVKQTMVFLFFGTILLFCVRRYLIKAKEILNKIFAFVKEKNCQKKLDELSSQVDAVEKGMDTVKQIAKKVLAIGVTLTSLVIGLLNYFK